MCVCCHLKSFYSHAADWTRYEQHYWGMIHCSCHESMDTKAFMCPVYCEKASAVGQWQPLVWEYRSNAKVAQNVIPPLPPPSSQRASHTTRGFSCVRMALFDRKRGHQSPTQYFGCSRPMNSCVDVKNAKLLPGCQANQRQFRVAQQRKDGNLRLVSSL